MNKNNCQKIVAMILNEDNAFSQTIVGHNQYRFQVVANRFELFLLLLSERHNLTPASDLVKSGDQFTRAAPSPPS